MITGSIFVGAEFQSLEPGMRRLSLFIVGAVLIDCMGLFLDEAFHTSLFFLHRGFVFPQRSEMVWVAFEASGSGEYPIRQVCIVFRGFFSGFRCYRVPFGMNLTRS